MEAGKNNRITIRLDHMQTQKHNPKRDQQAHLQKQKQDQQDQKQTFKQHYQTFTPSKQSEDISSENMKRPLDLTTPNEDFSEGVMPMNGYAHNKPNLEIQREAPEEYSSQLLFHDTKRSYKSEAAYWQTGDMDDDKDYSAYFSQRKRPMGLIGWAKKMLHSSQLLIIAGSAIGVGLILGFLVLTLFSKLDQENLPVVYSQGVLQPSFTNTENNVQGSTGDNRADGSEEVTPNTELPSIIPSGQVEGNQLTLPAKQFYIVQAGAFSTRDSALELAQTYTANGYPYMMNETQEPIRLYVGFGFNREQMLLLGQFYQNEGYEVWVRELETAEIAVAVEGATTEALSQFSQYVTYTELFYEEANELVVKGISTGADFTIGAEAWSRVQTKHRQLLDWRQQHYAAWPEELKVMATELHSNAQNTYHALEEYRSKRNQVFLWQALQSTMNYLDSYQSWQN